MSIYVKLFFLNQSMKKTTPKTSNVMQQDFES